MKFTEKEKLAIREEINRKKAVEDDAVDDCKMLLYCERCPLGFFCEDILDDWCADTSEEYAKNTSHRLLMRAMRIALLEDALGEPLGELPGVPTPCAVCGHPSFADQWAHKLDNYCACCGRQLR